MNLRTKRRLDAGCLLAILVVFVIAGMLTWVARQREVATSRAEIANLTTALELYVRSTVTSIDQSLIGASHALRLIGLADQAPATFKTGSEVLAAAVAQLGLPVAMYLVDVDGRTVYSNDQSMPTASAADREYFRIHQTRADAGLHVSELITSRVSGLASLIFSRRIDDAQGVFAGVLLVSAPVSVFERDFGRLGASRSGTVSLGDDTGRLYARRPPRPDLIGRKLVSDDSEALKLLRSGVAGGLVAGPTMLDKAPRLTGFQRVGSTRLVVTVSNTFADQLAPWRLQAIVVAATGLLLGAGSLLLFTLLTRDLVRKTQLTEDLRQAVAALEQSVQAEQEASAAKTAFLSSMSHELMTPLNGIYGAVQLWQLGEKDEGRQRLAQVARTSTERLNTALRDALAYANATSSAVESALAPFGLSELLDELPEMFDAQPGSEACRLELASSDGWPGRVHTDPAALRDVLRRMLGVVVSVARRVVVAPVSTEDADDASPLGAVGVRVEPQPAGGGWRIVVGTLIEPGAGDDLDAALKPFADSAATESQGLHDAGLSLEVARLLAVRAGGALQVDCRKSRLTVALVLPPAD